MSDRQHDETALRLVIGSVTRDQMVTDEALESIGRRGVPRVLLDSLVGLAQFLAVEAYGDEAANELRAHLYRLKAGIE